MKFLTRKWVKPEKSPYVVTKFMSEIDFVSSARAGDIIELGMEPVKFGRTSISLRCKVRNIMTHHTVLVIERITFVNLDSAGLPAPHGVTNIAIE